MSKYTITLDEYATGRYLADNPDISPLQLYSMPDEDYYNYTFELFPSSFPIYAESERETFKKHFVDHFRFDEIGQETLQMWKHYLKCFLQENMGRYADIYRSAIDDITALFQNTLKTTRDTGGRTYTDNEVRDLVRELTRNLSTARTPNLTTTDSGSSIGQIAPFGGSGFTNIDKTPTENTNTLKGTDTTLDTGTEQTGDEGTIEKSGEDSHDNTIVESGYSGINKVAIIEKYRQLIVDMDDLIFADAKKYGLFMLIH